MDKSTLNYIIDRARGYCEERIAAQLRYAFAHCLHGSNACAADVDRCLRYVRDCMENGRFFREELAAAEEMLAGVGKEIKETEVLCVAHAHMDMNWTWGYDETVSIVLSTLRTMLALMDEYPDFTFSQSQASVYRIVEKYAPDMLAEIRARIREGRWEVAASTWVESDKNMPCGESVLRQFVYTRRYLSELLDIDPDSLNFDFEPDTFGHSANLPEILAEAGVRYYYHCRGSEGPDIYRWQAKSGAEILCYRDPTWYNLDVNPMQMSFIPEFRKKYGLKKILKVYGVGNHGGGVTRKDLDTLADMRGWPAMPTLKFSRYSEFFDYLERERIASDRVRGEQNFIFSGCYSAQSKIKAANRQSERALLRAEKLSAFATESGYRAYDARLMRECWTDTLFSHFHDIITGSCVEESRNYALAKAQEVNAATGAAATAALGFLAGKVDTSAYAGRGTHPIAQGAGAGFLPGDGVFSANAGDARDRLFLLWNETARSGEFVVPVTLWDYDNGAFIKAETYEGERLDCSCPHSPQGYWGHYYQTVYVRVNLPAYGYRVIVLSEDTEAERPLGIASAERLDEEKSYVLENDFLRAVFSPANASLVSLFDKKTQTELIEPGKSGGFRFVEEDDGTRRTAWVEGNRKRQSDLIDSVRIVDPRCMRKGLVRSVFFEAKFENSKFTAEFSLDACSDALVCDVVCDFMEAGRHTYVPRLEYALPLARPFRAFYDIPFGVAERAQAHCDRPANSFVYGAFDDDSGVMLTTDSRYGFRAEDGALSVTLIRASSDPDPFPELGRHKFRMGIIPCRFRSAKALIERSAEFSAKILSASVLPAAGKLPACGQMMRHEGAAVVSCVKPAERGEGIVVRLFDAEGGGCSDRLCFPVAVGEAYACDGNERRIAPLPAEDGEVTVPVGQGKIRTVEIVFKKEKK